MDLSTTSPTANTTYWTEDQNPTSDSSCSVDEKDWTFTFIPVYIMIISVLGIVLNVFILMVFSLHKKACTTPEIYLSNMAAADLVLVSFLPFWAIYAYNHFHWTFGQAMCKIVNMSIMMNSSCSIYFLVLVSIDRYLALVHPLSFERIRTPGFAKLGCLLMWIMGFIFSVPDLIYRELVQNDNQIFCNIKDVRTVKITFGALYFVFGFIIPVIIIFFCTLKIIKVLRSRPVEVLNAKKTDQKATTLVLAVLLAFLICWVPYYVIRILRMLLDFEILTGCKALRIFYICGQIFSYLAFFNSVLNPILYVIVGKNFRGKAKELIRQGICERTLTLSQNSTSTNL